MKYKVSVVLPTCDRPETLGRAVRSIRALESDDLDLEILVADNGKDPDTPKTAADAGAVYLRVDAPGPSAARNAALFAATGDFIAFLDDDDVWLPGHLRPHLQAFQNDPGLDLMIGQVQSANELYEPIGLPWPVDLPTTHDDLLRRMLGGYFPQVGAILVRSVVREKVGGFDIGLPGGEDLDWLLRILSKGRAQLIATPCVLFTHRRPGSFDDLQWRRVKYDRLVFHRHARRWPHLWRSPAEYWRAYSGTLMPFYGYFIDAALERALRGARAGALSALWKAARIFPLRLIKHLVTKRDLRRAVLRLLLPVRAASMAHIPLYMLLDIAARAGRMEPALGGLCAI